MCYLQLVSKIWKTYNIIPLRKTSFLSIICNKCKNEDEKLFEEDSIKILKILGWIENLLNSKIWQKKNVSREFWLKNIDETRNYLIEEIKWNELMSKKHKKILQLLSYIENFL